MSKRPIGIINIPYCRRSLLAATICALVLPASATLPAGLRDPVFERLQFSRWAASGQAHIKWTVEIPLPELSTHQRLMVRVVTKIDGRELEKRRGQADLFALLQLTDSSGQIWQHHTAIDLAKLPPNLRNKDFTITHYAFVKPGDYALSIAICDDKTLEHSITSRRIHVDPVKGEPLPRAFDGLPSVEFVPPSEKTPDVWFIPDIQSRLNLPISSKRPLQLQVLVNTTPSERSLGSGAALRRNMSLLIPAMKLLAGIIVPNGSVDVAFLDLEKRKVAFEQPQVNQLDWSGLSKIFGSTNPGIVDVGTLANDWKMRGYFLDEVSQRLQAPLPADAARVVIVLSGPAFFDDPARITPDAANLDPSRQLYYIRCRTLSMRMPRRNRPGVRPVVQRPIPIDAIMPPDDLEKLAMGLNGKVFDATSTDGFRRILAKILDQIAAL